MQSLQVENRTLDSTVKIARNIAVDIYQKGMIKNIAIVDNRPRDLLGPVRKQWLKIIRRNQNKRSSTLNSELISMLGARITWMQHASFGVWSSQESRDIDIVFATFDDVIGSKNKYIGLYVVCHLGEEQIERLVEYLSADGRAVIYEPAE